MAVIQPEGYLQHYGILGQKWGVRRYQNEDGSLTADGKLRYGISPKQDAKAYTRDIRVINKTVKKAYDARERAEKEVKRTSAKLMKYGLADIRDPQRTDNTKKIRKYAEKNMAASSRFREADKLIEDGKYVVDELIRKASSGSREGLTVKEWRVKYPTLEARGKIQVSTYLFGALGGAVTSSRLMSDEHEGKNFNSIRYAKVKYTEK